MWSEGPVITDSSRRQPFSTMMDKKLVQKAQVEILVNRKKDMGYWTLNFILVLLPFLPIGMPVHGLIIGGMSPPWKSGRREWWQILGCTGSAMGAWYWTLVTLILGALALAFNGVVIYYFGFMCYHLLILGRVEWTLARAGMGFFFYLPFAGLVGYMWMSGFSFRSLVHGFDDLERTTRKLTATVEGKVEGEGRSGGGHRRGLCLMYLMVILIHLIHYFLVSHRSVKEKWDEETSRRNWLNYLPFFLYTLILPWYACLCWGIGAQFQGMGALIDSLMSRKVRLSQEHLYLFKGWYKGIADGIIYVNFLCGLTMSWILIVLGFSVYSEIKDTTLYFMDVVLKSFSVDPTRSTFGGVIDPTTKAGTMTHDFDLSPDIVRYFMGQLINAALYLALVMYTIWQAVRTNDEARYFHVWLNDFASSDPKDVHGIDGELYRAFHLFKLYVHSRMELERPALLNILILAIIPALRNRLVAYNVRH